MTEEGTDTTEATIEGGTVVKLSLEAKDIAENDLVLDKHEVINLALTELKEL